MQLNLEQLGGVREQLVQRHIGVVLPAQTLTALAARQACIKRQHQARLGAVGGEMQRVKAPRAARRTNGGQPRALPHAGHAAPGVLGHEVTVKADCPDKPVCWDVGHGKFDLESGSAPKLHDLALSVRIEGAVSDTRKIRFGIREISYELSLVDKGEALQRVAVSPARGAGEQLLDVTHNAIRKVEGGWAVSLARDIAGSPALAPVQDAALAPHLLIRVNGVPIAVRGGNWGMDDWMKRVSRERMEPYFRLHREANVNTVRNWMGQSTERVFFELADEYGLLVLNDFWLSTQDHNGEPGDSALFLANAADTVSRFQHHPSIALWIGHNEGVPPPVLNRAFEKLVREFDGTRAYLPNSRDVNMANSGPWNYQPPEAYFTRIGRGFSTEVGTPSLVLRPPSPPLLKA